MLSGSSTPKTDVAPLGSTARVADTGTRVYHIIAEDSCDALPPISCLEHTLDGDEPEEEEPTYRAGDLPVPRRPRPNAAEAPHGYAERSARRKASPSPTPMQQPSTPPPPPPTGSPTLLELATAAAAAERCELKCKREGSEDLRDRDDDDEPAPKRARVVMEAAEPDFGVLQACNGTPKVPFRLCGGARANCVAKL
jgi:hypothetical protein